MKKDNVTNTVVAKKKNKNDWTRFILLFALFATVAFFGIVNPRFVSLTNIMDMLRTASIIGTFACGLTVVMTSGYLNLALGAQATCCAVIFGLLMEKSPGWEMYPVFVLITIACSIVLSLLTGVVTIELGIPAYIATLGIKSLIDALVSFLTNNTMLYSTEWTDAYFYIGNEYVFDVIPVSVVLFLFITLVMIFITEKTRSGRHLYATGSNLVAATQVGIPVRRMRYLSFVICGVMIAIGGIILGSYSYSVSLTVGQDYQMPAIVAVMLGATFLTPGKYNIIGTVIGAILFTCIQNGIIGMGAPFYIRDAVQGLVLMLAIGTISLTREGGLSKVTFEN